MRIAHVIASLLGGAAVQMTLLAAEQLRAGHQVTIIAPDDCPSAAERLAQLRALDWRAWAPQRARLWRDLGWMQTILAETRPDVVHCHGQRGALYARFAASRLQPRPRVVYTLHGFHIPHYPTWWRRAGARAIERVLARWTDAVICLTEEDLASVNLTMGPAYAARCRVVANAVPPVVPARQSRAALCAALGVPAAGFRVGTVARLRRQKALHVLLDAFARLREQRDDIVLVIVGEGQLLPDLLRRTHLLGVANDVYWLGDRSDVLEILYAFDVFALPSLWEGMPLALMEAMAAGVPVVATDVPGNRQLVQHEHNGLLVPVNDAPALASGVLRLLTDPSLARRLSEAAVAECRERFDVSAMVTATQCVYEGR